jgi:hypothetical protein
MPDDMAQWAQARGAQPVTLRFRPEGASTTQRHATWRIPADDPRAHRLEQLHAGGHLDGRLYANACAVLALWIASGLGASAVADYQRREKATGAGDVDRETAEDVLRRLIEGGTGTEQVDFQGVIMLIRGDVFHGGYMFTRAKRALRRLDWLAAKWDGECWRDEA